MAGRVGLSLSSIEKMRARFRAQGLWAPWYDLDLRAAGLDSVVIFAGVTSGGADAGTAERVVPQVLAAHRVPGVFIAGDGQLFGVTLPRTLDALCALEAGLLEVSAPKSGQPWLATLEVLPIPYRSARFVDYSRLLQPANGRRGSSRAAPEARGAARMAPPAAPFTRRERSVLLHLLRHPETTVAQASAAARIPERTFARIKGQVLRDGVLRPATRLNLVRLGYRHLLVIVLRHRPVRSAARHLSSVAGMVPGSAPIMTFLSPTRTALIAPYKEIDDAREAVRAAQTQRRALRPIAPPLTMLYSYATLRRAGFALSGDVGSAWLQTLGEPPSVGPMREAGRRGALVEAERAPPATS